MLDIARSNWQLLLIGQFPNGPLGGLAMTLILAVSAIAAAFVIGTLIALARTSGHAVLQWPATVLVYVVRGLPPVMAVFWAYFALPALIGRPIPGFWTLLAALILYESAYLSEILRAGIRALPKGQFEASRALGMGYLQTTRDIVLPQVYYTMLPSMVSQFVSTIKETSLGYIIAVQELTFATNQLNSQLLTRPFEVFMLLAVIYFAVCSTLTSGARLLERRTTKLRNAPVLAMEAA
ncbi:amino acid ABC transporter permease [Methylobacterium nodulans]|uniref:Polar amino acid ABC transporter, inner membrane subunit n=1 Tax=Methylobacterium nodulans (strain LMG 21967 / CNCM I-2342 / ORS 2060) TaxID=460265 RepID=B8IGL5_METNO|nr:amino acid ABC transporter permease [Methylobacterium nodulans]ACL55915.1 polar amino acid ABC transporter, inner membrane subunit [Methylobacterium nodulans ORS 2060]